MQLSTNSRSRYVFNKLLSRVKGLSRVTYLRRSWDSRRNYTGVARRRGYSLFKQKPYGIKSGIRRISRRGAQNGSSLSS